uniref:glycoside hydrolase family 44 protein n=1 Tax=Dyadobacter sp. TaxID=1914288 RepID=UPI003F71C9D6
IRYWNMDNEPEIWSGTHDDVMPRQISPKEFMQRYIDLAKKARAKFPGIKLVGPVTANEWQWYNWDGKPVGENGKTYPWLEYFIKTVAEEQQKSGIRLLDVLDIHFYPGTKNTNDVTQLHRVFFDRNYIFPEANGVKTINGGYDNSINKEYIFARCNDWLVQYLGAGHGVTLGLTEAGIDQSISAPVTAVWYASTMGEFMKNGVEIFTPWTWKPGMWEVLHLLSRYNQARSVKGTSANETLVSAYPSINAAGDSLTLVLVNRSPEQSQSVRVNLSNFIPAQGNAPVYTLSELPATETFRSHTQNALKKSEVAVTGNVLNASLPAMSVTAMVLRSGGEILGTDRAAAFEVKVFPNPTRDRITVQWAEREFSVLEVFDLTGRQLSKINLQKTQREAYIDSRLAAGTYLVKLTGSDGRSAVKQIIVP